VHATCDQAQRRKMYARRGYRISHILNFDLVKVTTGKFHPITGHKGQEGGGRHIAVLFI